MFWFSLQLLPETFLILGRILLATITNMPVPVAARSKAWVCDRSSAEIVGSNPTGAWAFVCCECCVLSGRGLCDDLITRTEESYRLWCVAVCDLETSWMRRPWPTGALSLKKNYYKYLHVKYPCFLSHFKENCIFSTNFRNMSLRKNSSSGSRFVLWGRTAGQTNMKKWIVVFCSLRTRLKSTAINQTYQL